jgi:hypothetical protein
MFSARGVALNVTTASVQLRVVHNSDYLSARLKLRGNNCNEEETASRAAHRKSELLHDWRFTASQFELAPHTLSRFPFN